MRILKRLLVVFSIIAVLGTVTAFAEPDAQATDGAIITASDEVAGDIGGAEAMADAEDAEEEPVNPVAAMIQTFMLPVLLLGVLYFVMIRPQRKKDKALKAMLADVKTGDEIVTIGGIHGKIVRIKDDTVIIESGAGNEKSKLKMDRGSIARIEKKYEGKKAVMPVPDFEEEDETEDEE